MPTPRPVRVTLKMTLLENEMVFKEAAKTGETISGTIRGLIADGIRYRKMSEAIMQRLEKEGQLL